MCWNEFALIKYLQFHTVCFRCTDILLQCKIVLNNKECRIKAVKISVTGFDNQVLRCGRLLLWYNYVVIQSEVWMNGTGLKVEQDTEWTVIWYWQVQIVGNVLWNCSIRCWMYKKIRAVVISSIGLTDNECPASVQCPASVLCPAGDHCLTGDQYPTGDQCPTGDHCPTGD